MEHSTSDHVGLTVSLLRFQAKTMHANDGPNSGSVSGDAADIIEQQAAEIERLKAQLAVMRRALEDAIRGLPDLLERSGLIDEEGMIPRLEQAFATDAGKEAAAVLEAVEPFPAMWSAFRDSDGNQTDAYYKLAKSHWSDWEKLCLAVRAYRATLEKAKQ